MTNQAQSVRSVAVAKTWKNKKVAAARLTHHEVRVDRKKYNSVLAAFNALGLDTKKHIRFRGELKAKGRATFEGHRFSLVLH